VDDIREQKGRVLLDVYEAKQRLEAAQRSHTALVNRIAEFLETFRTNPSATLARGEKGIPTPHEIIETAKELCDAQESLRSAEKKKAELGLA